METAIFLKASKYLYFLVFITAYILFHYSYKSIFIVKIFIVKMIIITIITIKHSVKYRAREMVMLQDWNALKLQWPIRRWIHDI